MLTIMVPESEFFNELTGEFITTPAQKLDLEHSLISLSRWESKWHKPFLTKDERTEAETLDYIRCMTITKNVDPRVYFAITPENISEIKKYIDDPMTATTFKNYRKSGRHGKDIITSEVIYYQMVALQIPFECEKWHLNRLLTLIEVCNRKNSPDKKMSKKQIADQNRALNALRRKKFGTRG